MTDLPEANGGAPGPGDPENPSGLSGIGQPSPQELPPYVIEGARSSRSKCKSCRRTIKKDVLRLGILFDGPYGTGYLWHHLTCAARRRAEELEAAYAAEAWNAAKVVPAKIPSLDELRQSAAEVDARRQKRRDLPYAEIDPSGRARCKQCGELLPKGALRVVLGREVEFGNQTRVGPVNVHPACVAQALTADDCATTAEDLQAELGAHSDLSPQQIADVLAAIDPLS
ncbi:MAG: hypothetical protein ACE5IK_03410 [Acidobacteriota bacterium]